MLAVATPSGSGIGVPASDREWSDRSTGAPGAIPIAPVASRPLVPVWSDPAEEPHTGSLGSLLRAQEEERARLARDLHDIVGQALVAARMQLVMLAASASPDPSAEPQAGATGLTAALEAVDEALRQVRGFTFDLRPTALDDLGLVPALRWFVQRAGLEAGVLATVTAVGVTEPLDHELETVCFRIAQEAVSNVIRHAAAASIQVSLVATADRLVLEVRDDGAGFDPRAAAFARPDGAGLGLLGMRERAAIVGGQVEIASAPGEGTRVTATMPLSTLLFS